MMKRTRIALRKATKNLLPKNRDSLAECWLAGLRRTILNIEAVVKVNHPNLKVGS